MALVKATEDGEKGFAHTAEEAQAREAMGRFNDELRNAGIFIAADGLKPSSHGKRIAFAGSDRTVIDGPFVESRELVAGFWIWQVKDMERDGCLGEALPQSHAWTERDRNSAILRDG